MVFVQRTANEDRRGERYWTPTLCLQVIESIGEELIRDRLKEIYKEKFASSLNIDVKLDALKAEVALLEYDRHR
ncbi:hypothetical protein SAMN05421821_10164 [Mucilaginibacter lappiensis]|uniref:Uncharacterized protein n=1 Tax=Mucilaginibacter lappiensis TaxID=354630 RepID=A0ABR6PE25_9SPHI|nr:hypothetical protein [Mucilaginibacter lappiensis]SIP89318.1 hypothetical protein SAMN05421821_10164 [Mucilaginibacter lappiensis]